MKKKLIILIIITILLVGCNKTKKYYLEAEAYEKGSIIDISLEEFKKLEEDKKNFAIFVYLPGCTSCAQFRTVLDEFIQNNNIQFYAVSILDVIDTSIDDTIEYAPSMILYKEGEVVTYLDSVSDKDKSALTNTDAFKKWLEKYIYLEKNNE